MMKSTRILTLALFACLFAACGDASGPDRPATAPAAEPAPAVPATDSNPAPTGESRRPVEVVEESAGEAAAEPEAIVLAQAETAEAAPQLQKYREGTHFTKLTTAQGTSSSPDAVEVAEVFWYGCPHCYNFDPIVDNWAQTLPDDVNLIRLPVMWNPTNAIHARLFYTVEALGKLDEVHSAIFNELHVNNRMLTNEAEIIEFVEKFGISADEFKKTFRSFAVESKLKRAKNLTQRYRIQSVPLFVINGKYLTTGDGIKNFDDMLAVADDLIIRERLAR